MIPTWNLIFIVAITFQVWSIYFFQEKYTRKARLRHINLAADILELSRKITELEVKWCKCADIENIRDLKTIIEELYKRISDMENKDEG